MSKAPTTPIKCQTCGDTVALHRNQMNALQLKCDCGKRVKYVKVATALPEGWGVE